MTYPSEGPEHELYLEAVRTVPAVMAAKVRKAPDDGDILVKAYLEHARELRVPLSSAWAILCGAHSMAVMSLINLVADIQETTKTDVVERMVEAALEQVTTGGV